MLKAEERMEIAVLKKHGESIRAIARTMGVSRNTVRRYLRGGEGAAVRKPVARRVEKLDPVQGLHRRAAEGCGAGSDTGVGAVPRGQGAWLRRRRDAREAVRARAARQHRSPIRWCGSRPSRVSRCRLTGRVSDAGRSKLSVFIATLGWSRASLRRVLRRRAGRDADRLPRECIRRLRRRAARGTLRQHASTVVLERNAYGRGVHRFHPGFLDYARHMGFLPRLCRAISGADQGQGRALHPLSQGAASGCRSRHR